MISNRLMRALGVAESDIIEADEQITIHVLEIDRRYRDAIKAGAEGIRPPHDEDLAAGERSRRIALMRDQESGSVILLWSIRS